jgi:predicted ABC-type sugar transport system permease subunit
MSTSLGTMTCLQSGLASMIDASRLMAGQPTGGESYELNVIAAVSESIRTGSARSSARRLSSR